MKFHLALFALVVAFGAALGVGTAAFAQEYGYAAKRPIMGAACPNCVWGPFAVVTKNIMAKRGWDIQICWNCNRTDSPRFVAEARTAKDLTAREIEVGYLPPPKGPVDFGVTNQRLLQWSYDGTHDYVKDGPQKHLRLIAAFEDPIFLAVAVDKKSGITDLKDIAAKKMPVRIFPGNPDDVLLTPIFEHYGITPKQLESWGGKFVERADAMENGVDVIINRSASNANNYESMIWNWATYTKDLEFLTLPQELRERLVREFGFAHVTMPLGYFKGVKTDYPTVELSGQAVYARADMPDEFAYQLTKAMDEEREAYLWSIRPFPYDTRKVWKVGTVPLHPGAERYYREVGYMK
jgi:TRAP transporter TAXI family solute receptor